MWLAERAPVDDRQRRLAAGLSRLRHRHREADRGRARSRSAPRHRRRRSDRTILRGGVGRRRRMDGSTRRVARGRMPLVVGGTGLYLRALFEGLFEEPPLDRDRRVRARGDARAMLTVDELRRWVEALDPPRAHLGRTQLLRADRDRAADRASRLSDLHRDARDGPPLAAALSCGGSGAGAGRPHRARGSTTCSITAGQTRCDG